jgi:hypothetical protein
VTLVRKSYGLGTDRLDSRGVRMADTTTELAVRGITAADVWTGTVRGLAEVRQVSEHELLAEIARCGGDLVIKSKEAEVMISTVEVEVLGDVELVDQSHLGRGELTSLRSLSDVLWRRWVEVNQAVAR